MTQISLIKPPLGMAAGITISQIELVKLETELHGLEKTQKFVVAEASKAVRPSDFLWEFYAFENPKM